MIRVILAGEGKNELGGFAVEPSFRDDNPEPGVVEALLRQVRPEGWKVVDAILWKNIPKLRVGIGGKGEELNVQRASHHAKKRGCEVFAFTRDRDGAKFALREEGIERAIEELTGSADQQPTVVGGVAVEKLESWLVAVAGHHGSEGMRRPHETLAELGINEKDTAAMVRLVEENGLTNIPADARSLRRWIERARRALGEPAPMRADSA
ncbi:hypothetical protein [Sorangium sp. So ce854]|uniref:hypothetical protein n=1 Tax=Sorangium sp. So ce854 TaxID=3133322 RepID=UPI003F6361D9